MLSKMLSILSNELINLLRKTRPSNKNMLFLVHAQGVLGVPRSSAAHKRTEKLVRSAPKEVRLQQHPHRMLKLLLRELIEQHSGRFA